MTTAEHDREQWLAERRTGIGSSDAAAACGLSQYRTALDVYCDKLQLVPPQEDNRAMRLGRRMEPVLAAEYEDQTGAAVARPIPMRRHAEHPCLLANLDGLREGTDWIVEFKTANLRQAKRWGEPGSDEIPDEYMAQVQHQMMVNGSDLADVAVLIAGSDFRIYTVERSDRLVRLMLERELELWDRIQRRDPPSPDYAHPRDQELLKILHAQADGPTVDATADVATAWAEIQGVKAAVKAMESRIDELKAEVLHGMADAGAMRLGDGREVYRVQISESVVTKKEVDELARRIGQVKRQGYFYLRERKEKVK